MSFKYYLLNIKNNYSKKSSQTKEMIFEKCIKNKLDRSLNKYLEEVQKNINYILSRNNNKVMATIERRQKKEKYGKSN